MSQVFAGHNFNSRIGVQFNLPVIWRSYGYQSARGSESGIGDVSLVGNLRLYEKLAEDFTFNWTGLGGLKFPTGSTSQLNPELPDFAPGIGGHDLTLGSGSYDGVVGTGFYARWKRVFMAGSMQYAIRTEGAYRYQFANDWTWMGGPGVYLVLGHRHTLSLQAAVSGESKGQDTLAGVATADTAVNEPIPGAADQLHLVKPAERDARGGLAREHCEQRRADCADLSLARRRDVALLRQHVREPTSVRIFPFHT
jgi:hypothetical protein